MMNKEEYKKELVRMWDSVRDDKFKGRNNCEGVICSECQFCDINDNDCYTSINAVEMVEVVEKWSKEHPPKHKVSQVEYDILKSFKESNLYSKFYFNSSLVTRNLLKLGYFEGADEYMKIKDYLDNCEVADDEG